ncbi:MAG: translation initiation factor IF-3 [Acidimicrobiales bacterium]|nr:MAG: translation initiation factor IF-3 [Acidimicrobiales bacterium]
MPPAYLWCAFERRYEFDREYTTIAGIEDSGPRINDQIRAARVRVVDPDGNQIGIMTVEEALARARDLDLDLVEVAPQADPPVCRIMDYGKYKYEESQRARESRKKATHVTVKEIKYRPKIGRGDFETKTRKVREFLEAGHKVKVTVMFRGREITHRELGEQILEEVERAVEDIAKVEAYPRLETRNNITMVLAPDKRKRRKASADGSGIPRAVSSDGSRAESESPAHAGAGADTAAEQT